MRTQGFLIINLILPYLNFEEYSVLLTLNSSVNKSLKSSKEFKHRILNYISKFLKTEMLPKKYKDQIYSITGIKLNTKAEISTFFSNTENFIVNPCGNFEFEEWEKYDGGDGWAIESDLYYKKYLTCFVASFDWCHLIYDMDYDYYFSRINRISGKKLLIAGSPVCRRQDCESKAKIKIKITDSNQKVYIKETLTYVSAFGTTPDDWELLSTVIEIPKHARNATITFSGCDLNYWKGHYGPKFGYCYIRVLTIP